MTRRVYLYFTLTFILGGILGGGGEYYLLWSTGRLSHRGFNKDRAIAHFKNELDLSADQVQQISKIFDDSSQKVRDIQKQTEPQLQTLHLETRGRIRQILNPDQAKKFDELMRQVDERRKRRATSPPPS
jgi:Spy/CpxP family protein refolding chaperone